MWNTGVAVRVARLARWLGLAVCGLLLMGCGQVEVSEAPRTPVAAAAARDSRPEHDLSVLAAEISPPLSELVHSANGAVSLQLLVAIENRGGLAERDVIVEAWLEAGQGGGPVILTAKTIVPYLAPGEVKVAKLNATGVITIMPSYVMTVSARPVPFETYVGNNTCEYGISVSVPAF
jgi:hypothetical protein